MHLVPEDWLQCCPLFFGANFRSLYLSNGGRCGHEFAVPFHLEACSKDNSRTYHCTMCVEIVQ